MREPTPIESDDEEWEWIDDEPVLRSDNGKGRNGQSGQNGHPNGPDDPEVSDK